MCLGLIAVADHHHLAADTVYSAFLDPASSALTVGMIVECFACAVAAAAAVEDHHRVGLVAMMTDMKKLLVFPVHSGMIDLILFRLGIDRECLMMTVTMVAVQQKKKTMDMTEQSLDRDMKIAAAADPMDHADHQIADRWDKKKKMMGLKSDLLGIGRVDHHLVAMNPTMVFAGPKLGRQMIDHRMATMILKEQFLD
jgi:hypothetical protein